MADAVFFSEKQGCLQRLTTEGFNLLNNGVAHVHLQDIEQRFIPGLIEIVRTRVQIDVSLIALLYQDLRTELLGSVKGRAGAEHFSILSLLQGYSQKYVAIINDRRVWSDWVKHYKTYADGFNRGCEAVIADIDRTQPVARWMKALNELVGVHAMAKYEIRGSQVVIAETGATATQINASLSSQHAKEALAEAFALLKAEVQDLADLSTTKRKQVLNTIDSAELEAAEKTPDKNRLATYLATLRSAARAVVSAPHPRARWQA
jgi:hypothetical protein